MFGKRHCPHSNLVGIYGDRINHTPGGRRLLCNDCGSLLDGPVSPSRDRAAMTIPLWRCASCPVIIPGHGAHVEHAIRQHQHEHEGAADE